MPSPFPGMNPYLEHEEVWQDFHESFMPACRDALNANLPSDYIVRIDEHVYVHEVDTRLLLGRTDLGITRIPPTIAPVTATALLQAPVHVTLPQIDEERLSFLEIRDRRNWQVISIVELLSPSNKYAGPDRAQHLAKRNRLLHSAAHLVEIDLLRGGPRLPLRDLPVCDYYVMVSRAEQRPQAALWPLQLRDPLPTLYVPLRTPEEQCPLDLQAVLHRVYDMAGYQRWIYTHPPEPALQPDDAAWVQRVLTS